MLDLVAAMEIARRMTRSAMEEEPATRKRSPERPARLRPALAAGLRRLASTVDLPTADGRTAKASRSSSS